jgi:hypothetical protein
MPQEKEKRKRKKKKKELTPQERRRRKKNGLISKKEKRKEKEKEKGRRRKVGAVGKKERKEIGVRRMDLGKAWKEEMIEYKKGIRVNSPENTKEPRCDSKNMVIVATENPAGGGKALLTPRQHMECQTLTSSISVHFLFFFFS